MYKVISTVFFWVIVSIAGSSQTLPIEDRILNYKIIGFSFPSVKNASCYKLEVAAGRFNSEDSFSNHIILSKTSDKNRVIVKVPDFGRQYTWRVTIASGTTAGTKPGIFHHFSTGIIPWVDTNVAHLRVTVPAEKFRDAYVLLDGTGVMYDMSGDPVWYLPNVDSSVYETREVRDLKLTAQGTITFLLKSGKVAADNVRAMEVGYNGDILWTAPDNGKISGEQTEHYHHEFTRLTNGNYMILGDEYQFWELPVQDSSLISVNNATVIRGKNKLLSQKLQFGTIIEYDKKGHVLWSWKSSDYTRKSDIYERKTPNGLFNIGKVTNPKPNINDMHENAFYFDEKDNAIYVSFRNINRVIKIRYPSADLVDTYGELFTPGTPESGNNLFCGQHNCRLSFDGSLYLYNNSCIAGAGGVTLLRADASEKLRLKKVWEYKCETNAVGTDIRSNERSVKTFGFSGTSAHRQTDVFSQKSIQFDLTSGGSVFEMPDSSIFVSTCIPYNDLFIVNRDKKILWSAYAEKYNKDYKTWSGVSSYRCHIIDSEASFEKLIWANSKGE
jgi:hypothetical protein